MKGVALSPPSPLHESPVTVKFLTTLERHFKVVHFGGFDEVRDALPSMLNAIRMVWIVSRSFNTDEKMVPLMERIATELTRRVSGAVRVTAILECGAAGVKPSSQRRLSSR